MKKLLSILTLGACVLGAATFAAEKKTATEKVVETTKKGADKVADATKAAVEKVTGDKALPMNARADSIDASARTFTQKRRDGVEVKHVVAATAEIMNGDAAAKFEDIKVGDSVAGLRKKKSDTEYEVVKITKFGPQAPKARGEKKPEEKKP